MGQIDPNVKQFQLTGDAATSYGGGMGATKKGRTRKLKTRDTEITKTGGGSTSPGTATQLAASHVPGIQMSPVVGVNSGLTQKGAPAAIGGGEKAPTGNAQPLSTQAFNALPFSGGDKAPAAVTKVVLAAAKKKGHILLAAPKATTAAKHKKTRKVSRSIKMSMTGLDKKLTRAKSIRKDAAALGFTDLKKALHKAGLIKLESKAPESILRQMYADYMMLKDRAL
jgi:hypothetical protein